MKRTATAVWTGAIMQGAGTLTTESGVLKNAPYSFRTRFENEPGTNPEELVAAAHAGCFSMALALILEQAGITPERIETSAAVTLAKEAEGFTVTGSHLDVKVRAPGADPAAFQKAAETAEKNCPISKLLRASITMNATLEN
jgi:osmotically inducible protein OsmC